MKINISFLIVLILAVTTIISDALIYCLSCNYELSLIISFTLSILILVGLTRKKKIIPETNFEKIDVIFLLLFSAYTILNIVIPNFAYDVLMYHLYLQETPFIDKVNFDFFAGLSRNSFLFPLGDRMFYICRYFLGYRLGTILSYFSIIVLYYQIKNMIKLFIKKESSDLICIASMVIALIPTVINNVIGSYYIDLLSLIFEMQLVYYAFGVKDVFKNKFDKYLLFFIAGITIGLKISNLVLLIPIALFILIKNIKNIKQVKWYEYILMIVLCIIPFAIYMIDNYVQMGNLVYPFLADVFVTDYFGKFACIDSNYGVGNFFEALIWPIAVMIDPSKGDESTNNNLVFGIGYIITILYILIYLISKKYNQKVYEKYFSNSKPVFELCLIIVVMSILWAEFMMGYQRYGIVISILISILLAIIMIKTIINSKNLFLKIIVCGVVVILHIFTLDLRLLNLYQYYSYAIEYQKYYNGETYVKFENLLNDKEKQTISIDGVWGAIGDDSGIAALVREENTPIYILDRDELDKNDATDETYKRYYDNVKNNKVYVISLKNWLPHKLEQLNEYGFKIVDEIKVYKDLKFITATNYCYVFRVEYSDEYVGKNINKIEDVLY